jgi:hypothetical protein
MKNIELFWNIVYYGIYRFDIYLRYLVGFLNPFKVIRKIKVVKKYYSAHGVNDMNKLRNRILGNRESGISSIRSGGIIGGVLALIEYGLFNIIQAITGSSLIIKIWESNTNFIVYLICLLLPVVLINNYLLFKEDKYLKYFYEFDKLGIKKKQLYSLISFAAVIIAISFFFLSFKFLH